MGFLLTVEQHEGVINIPDVNERLFGGLEELFFVVPNKNVGQYGAQWVNIVELKLNCTLVVAFSSNSKHTSCGMDGGLISVL